jgi:transposase-like protein
MERQVREYSKEYKQEAVSLALSYGNVNQPISVPGSLL